MRPVVLENRLRVTSASGGAAFPAAVQSCHGLMHLVLAGRNRLGEVSATPEPHDQHAGECDDESKQPPNRGAFRDYAPVVVRHESILGTRLLYLLSVHAASLRRSPAIGCDGASD